jgi:uncharacterized protein YoxC
MGISSLFTPEFFFTLGVNLIMIGIFFGSLKERVDTLKRELGNNKEKVEKLANNVEGCLTEIKVSLAKNSQALEDLKERLIRLETLMNKRK